MFERALTQYPDSFELKLRIIDELVTLARFEDAETQMAKVQKAAPNDWRVAWYRGRALLNQGKLKETLESFQHMVDEFPGELAPRQALGVAFEAAGQIDRAMRYYDSVSRADSSFASAALRLAGCLEEKATRPAPSKPIAEFLRHRIASLNRKWPLRGSSSTRRSRRRRSTKSSPPAPPSRRSKASSKASRP